MVNNTQNSKLDETVKETLDKYEASCDSADWSRMESMLDAAPKSATFKSSHVVNLFIGLAVLTAGFFLYRMMSKPATSVPTTVSSPVVPEKKVVVPPPAPQKTLISSPTPAPAEETVTAAEPVVKNDDADQRKEKKDIAMEKNKIKKDKGKPDQKTSEDEFKGQKVIGMGNEPVFGDMLDSSRGIVSETKEKEATKKAAKANKDLPVGWNQFMLPHVNTDSLKKSHEKKDTIK